MRSASSLERALGSLLIRLRCTVLRRRGSEVDMYLAT